MTDKIGEMQRSIDTKVNIIMSKIDRMDNRIRELSRKNLMRPKG